MDTTATNTGTLVQQLRALAMRTGDYSLRRLSLCLKAQQQHSLGRWRASETQDGSPNEARCRRLLLQARQRVELVAIPPLPLGPPSLNPGESFFEVGEIQFQCIAPPATTNFRVHKDSMRTNRFIPRYQKKRLLVLVLQNSLLELSATSEEPSEGAWCLVPHLHRSGVPTTDNVIACMGGWTVLM